MKKLSAAEVPEEWLRCVRCESKNVELFYNERVQGYYVTECKDCGSYSEIYRADVLQKYRPHKPRKTGDEEVPWVSQLTPKQNFSWKDRKTALIDRLFAKIRDKKGRR